MKASDLPMLASPFAKEEVHWRPTNLSERNGKHTALALAYLDARNVMDRLDEVCGIGGWQSEHYDCGGGRMGCKIGILIEWIEETKLDAQTISHDARSRWVWKTDGAGGTDVEADKGAFSDALKRAAVSWGIGRYLYSLGNTWVPCAVKTNGKFKEFTEDPWKYVKEAKQTWRGPLKKMELKNAMTELSTAMNSQSLVTTGDLSRVEDEFLDVIAQAKVDAPDWWRGYHGKHNELMATLPHGPVTGYADADNSATYMDN